MKIIFNYKSETKTCYRFENQNGGKETMQTIYLKKETFKDSGIDPSKGIIVNIEQA